MSATATTAPTEAEIRAVLAGRWSADGELRSTETYRRLEEAGSLAVAPLWWEAPDVPDDSHSDESGDEIWSDLRPSEATRLHELIGEAQKRAEQLCIEAIANELTAAALAFAAEYPDAPRATRKPVTA